MAAPESPLPPPPPDDRAPLGAHVSIAGGTWEAAPRCAEIAATGGQLFTKQANRWAEREVSPEEAARFRAAMGGTSVRWLCAHDSYLINLASPDPALRARSQESFRAELRRCHALGLDALVSHPGNYMDDRASGLARNADAIAEALEAEPGPTRLLMELTAGQGTVLGSTFEEMAALLGRLPGGVAERVGVCLDTAHVWAAGYDLVADYEGVWQRLEDALGIARLGCLHLNDSKAKCGSHLDRHELIGEGTLGAEPFRRIMTDPRLAAIPKVIETPKGDDAAANDSRMLRLLRSFAAGALLLATGVSLAAAPAEAQRTPGWRAASELGAVLGGTWLAGPNAPTVRTGAGLQGSVLLERPLAHGARGGLAARFASQPLALREADARWSAGALREAAVVGTLGMAPRPLAGWPFRAGVEGHAGVTLLAGGGTVLPFRGAARWSPVLEGGVVLARPPRLGHGWALVVRGGATRLQPAEAAAVSAGWVPRVAVAARRSP